MWRHAAALMAILTASQAAVAQNVRGTVSDSTSRLPVPGAVVVLLDAEGVTRARSITNARGEYRLPALVRTRGLRAVWMGFRPREMPIPNADTLLDVRMVAIPTMLEQVRVVANASCPRRSDRQAALALLEQARAGILNSVVAREAYPASMTILPFERHMQGVSERIEEQRVRTKSGDRVSTPFYAVRRAADFVRDGQQCHCFWSRCGRAPRRSIRGGLLLSAQTAEPAAAVAGWSWLRSRASTLATRGSRRHAGSTPSHESFPISNTDTWGCRTPRTP